MPGRDYDDLGKIVGLATGISLLTAPGVGAVRVIWAAAYGTTRFCAGCARAHHAESSSWQDRPSFERCLGLRRLEALGPRRKLQLSLVVAAALALLLALTGAVGPAAAAPVPPAVVVSP
jgi:predicted Fe-S protein YdhL (DUF1289 family)